MQAETVAAVAASVAAVASVGGLAVSLRVAQRSSETTLEVAEKAAEATRALERTRWNREHLAEDVEAAIVAGEVFFGTLLHNERLEPEPITGLIVAFGKIQYNA